MIGFSIIILSFLCVAPYCDFTLSIENYISFIPYLSYSILVLSFYKRKEIKSINLSNDGVSLSISGKLFFLNFLFFVLFILIYVLCLKLFQKYFTKNFAFFILYVLLIQNTVIRSPGFILMNIYINNGSFKNIIMLFINNILKYSIVIWILQPKEITESEIGEIIFFLILIMYLINYFYKYFISKKYFLFEKILGIKYYEVIDNKDNLPRLFV